MLVLGVNDAIEINVFPPSVNASLNASVNANARCEYIRNIVDTFSGCVNIFPVIRNMPHILLDSLLSMFV